MNTTSERQDDVQVGPASLASLVEAPPGRGGETRRGTKRRDGRLWDLPTRWLRANTFVPRWLPERWRHPLPGYLIAVLLQILAVGAMILLVTAFPQFGFVEAPVTLVVIAMALTWGAGPSLAATLLGALPLAFLILLPHFSPGIDEPEDTIGVCLYLVVGLCISVFASQKERSRQLAELACNDVKQLAATLDVERARLEATFEALADGVCIFDRDGRIMQANPALRELLSLDQDPSYLSLPWAERSPRLDMCDEQGHLLPEGEWPICRVLGGETIDGKDALDLQLRALNGRERFVSMSGAPVLDEQGQIVGAVLLYRDVTERRRLERRTHEALDALLAMAHIVVQGPTGTETAGDLSRSAATITGRQLAELTCRVLGCERLGLVAIEPATRRIQPLAVVGLSAGQERHWWAGQEHYFGDVPESIQPVIRRLQAGEVVQVDMTQPPFNDQRNLYDSHRVLFAPMCLDNILTGYLALDHGQVEHVYQPEEVALAGAVARLTALALEGERLLHERAEAQGRELALREANARMDEFLGLASHELRTPLTTVKGNIQLVQRKLKSMESGPLAQFPGVPEVARDFQQLLQRAARQVKVQERMIQDLLDVSRIQASKLSLALEGADLVSLVYRVVEDQRQSALARTIHLELPPGPCPAQVDVDRVGEVVSNYLNNALKYSAAERPVTVTLERQDSMARLFVRDEGVGLTAAEQEQIWDRFYQVRGVEVQTGSRVGLGLGLYICRMIIEQHGGQVGVQSTKGQGSTFWFTLPLRDDTGEEGAENDVYFRRKNGTHNYLDCRG